jgi:hypothetical protein
VGDFQGRFVFRVLLRCRLALTVDEVFVAVAMNARFGQGFPQTYHGLWRFRWRRMKFVPCCDRSQALAPGLEETFGY